MNRDQQWSHCRHAALKRSLTVEGDTGGSKLQALVYDILPSTTAVFSYAIESRKLSTNEQFFVGDQTVVNLLQTTHIKQGVSFIAADKPAPAQTKSPSFESRKNSSLLFFIRGGCVSLLRACLGARLFLQSQFLQLFLGCFYSHISTGTFQRALTAGQLRGDKECPFSGVTKSGRVWSKVPESDAGSVRRK